MQNLLETLKKAAEFLARKGLEKPRMEAEHLFAAGLGMKRLDLYLQFERLLDDEEVNRLRDMTVRRGNREPLQHIVGKVEFRDLVLRSDRRALIPRPETEELIDLALALFPAEQAVRVLDLGTGSGAIALALAAERPLWKVDAVDRSADALALARENAAQCGLTERVAFAESDWFSAVTDAYDLVVSNPPYLTEAEVAEADPEVREFDPKSALIAPEEGLADLRRILAECPPFLRAGGWVLCETGIGQHAVLAEYSAKAGFGEFAGLPDMSGRPRFWKAKKA
ncbi:MAG: protein-(glutamine-N5) methyltransferase, release factor-specific [Verrucomicrobiota bacterium]|jgi:release factor glutamine methyltransferase